MSPSHQRVSSRLVTFLIAFAGPAGPALARPAHPPPTSAEREQVLRFERSAALLAGPPPAPLAGQENFDVASYDLTLFLDLPGERIEGTSKVAFTPALGVPSVAELVLDLEDGNLTVTQVTQDGVVVPPASITHANKSLRIALSPAIQAGQTAVVAVDYQGVPRELGFGTLTFSTHGNPPEPVIFTLSEPFLGRGWWPSKDIPDDKATVTLRVEAPDTLTVVCNGTWISQRPGRPGYQVTTWRESYPISTYLVAVSASNYETWQETYVAKDSTPMLVQHWVYPEIRAKAERDFSVTVPLLEYFARAFYEYPFLHEKYGHVTIPLGGAMEHQTATSYGAQLVTGDNRYDWVVAHELAHQWWGNHVGPRTFESVWLNEGFATYSEALWWESVNGLNGYRAYMRAMDPVSRGGNDFPGTVHAPLAYFNSTVYDKGAWVLHMLRWVAGLPATRPDPESTILPILRAHGAAHAYGSAETADFVATASGVTGQDLTWFFDQWVHRPGRPSYQVGWAAAPQSGGGYVLHLRVQQSQPAPYRMPVLVRITLPTGTIEQVVWNDQARTDYSWPLAEAPTRVTWDEYGWVLKRTAPLDIDRDDDGWPDWLDGCPDVPNPGQEDLDANGIQDACQPGIDYDGDGVLNENDCAPADREVWSDPPDGSTVFVRRAQDGSVWLSFRHPDPQGQRAHVADLAGGDLWELRSSRSTAAAACLAKGDSSPDLADPSPPGDAYFLVHPWNGCGPTAGGVPLSPCRR